MIIRPEKGQLVLTRQIDHGHESGVLARLWGNETFARPMPFEELVDACGRHDEAWRHLDENPTVDHQTGQPHSFLTMPLDRLLPAYRDGAERIARGNPYGGFLVAMHYQGFFNQRFGLDQGLIGRSLDDSNRARIQEYLSAMEMMRGRFRSQAIERQRLLCRWATSPETTHAYLLLQVVDVISLFLCLGPGRTWPLGIVPKTTGGSPISMELRPGPKPGTHVVDPWPFRKAEHIVLRFPVRRIPDRLYTSDTDLRQTITGSPFKDDCHTLIEP
jgi:hypothetical protein